MTWDPDQYSAAALNQMSDWYASASERLRTIILKPPGSTISSQEFRQARAAQLITQVDTVLSQLNRASSGWLKKHASSAFQLGLENGSRQLREAGVAIPPKQAEQPNRATVQGSFSIINNAALAELATHAAGDLSKAARSMGDTAKRVIRNTAQTTLTERSIDAFIATGIIDGQRDETYRALREELIRVNKGQLIEVNGRHFDAGYYAEMVVRTRTREAVELGRHTRLAAAGIDLVRIVGRVSNNFCTAYLNQVFSLSGTHPKYPPLSSLQEGGPPFHPNCSKSTAPYIESLATPAQEKAAPMLADSKKLAGMSKTEAQKAFQDLQLRQQVSDINQKVARSITGKK